MQSSAIATAISGSIAGLRLLDHPYYRAWESGELRRRDLKGYAQQYRHFEACLPQVLSEVAAEMAPGEPRRLVESNLDDELNNPRPHLEMFDEFGREVGAGEGAAPTEAMTELSGLYGEAAGLGPVPLLAVVAAYEVQAAEVAATKAAALSREYGVGPAGTAFWTVHADVEQQHSAWTVEALTALDAPADEVSRWARRSARAWWGFLDERETARAAV